MSAEGYTKFTCNWRRAPLPAALDLDDLIALRAWLHGLGLIGVLPEGVGFGNISWRSKPGRFVISGTMTGKIPLAKREHFSYVEAFDIGRNSVDCTGEVAASSESLSHAALYSATPDIAWVAHVHQREFFAEKVGQLPTTDKRFEYGTTALALELVKVSRQLEAKTGGCIIIGGHEDGIIFFAETAAALRQRIEASGILTPSTK